MTEQSSQFPRFYVTASSSCPYLPGREERKIFTELSDDNPEGLHESMSRIGFRRSQDIAYRPSCEDCMECRSVRIPVEAFSPNRTQRRLINLNSDIVTAELNNIATTEQFELLSKYLKTRHPGGGMSHMSFPEYQNMVEYSPIRTGLIEYRLPSSGGKPGKRPGKKPGKKPGKLIGVSLTDHMQTSLSMVYSFFDVSERYKKRSLGTYFILDHVARARCERLDHVYLGYWVKDSPKMAYKRNFKPLEILGIQGWLRAE